MRIYSRNTRHSTHYYMRLLRTEFSTMDYWTLILALTALLALLFIHPHAAPMALVFIRLRWGTRFYCSDCGWEGEWAGSRCPNCGK
jgi:hypothetical protein